MKKRLLTLMLVFAMLLLTLAGCAGSTEETGKQEPAGNQNAAAGNQTPSTTGNDKTGNDKTGTDSGSTELKEIVIGIPGNPEVLSPFVANSTGRANILPTCYESLGCFTDSTYSDFKGQLLKSYEVADDNRTYTLHLYENIYDTAGNHLTADDVVFSWDKGHELGSSNWKRNVEDIQVVDEYTIVFRSIKDKATILNDVCKSVIVTKAAYEASPDEMATTPVSTAQYMLVDSTPGSTYVFEKNPNYWNKDESTWVWKSNVDRVTFRVILEESQMAVALETGAINIAVGMSNNNTDRYVGDSNYNMYQLVGNLCYSVLFNNSENSVFHHNQKLRQAVAYAIDVDGIIEAVLGGAGIKLGTYGFALAKDYREEWADTYYPYNVEKARELLKEAGYDPGTLEIKLVCGSGSIIQKTAELIQLYLLDAGFKAVTIESADNALFSTLKVDDTAWDILLDTKGSQTVASAANNLDREAYAYGNIVFVRDDDTFQDLVVPLSTISGATQENVDAYVEYFNDMCYMYCMYNTATYTVSTSNITYVHHNERAAVIPGMTEFE